LVGLREIDVFFLDEPTNHLDFHTLDWLEKFLNTFDGALVIVSHDRYFLDKICDTIWELPGDGSLWVWPGNYSDYIRRKTQQENVEP